MKILQKVLSAFLITTFLLAGCAPAKEKEKKIIIWHWMNDRQTAFDSLAEEYKKLTGIPVEFKLFSPPDIYYQKVVAGARAESLPDIFGILAETKIYGSFVKAGHILNLNPFMEADNGEWKNSFYPESLAVNVFKEGNMYEVPQGIYGVPIDTTLMQFVYNKSLFKESGLNPNVPPKTFDELISFAQQIKAKKGVDGFVCGWGEGWLLNCLATEWAINVMGEDKFLKTLKGDVAYTDPDWVAVFTLFAKMRDSGILASNIGTKINKEAEDAFSKGNAGFSFNGSWAVNVYKQLSPNLDYVFFSLPTVSAKNPAKVWGGAGSSFMVNAKSAQKDEAVKFLRWLTAKTQQEFLVKETSNIASIKGCEESLPQVLKPLTAELNNLTHPNIWQYNEDSRVIEVLNQGLQQIVLGAKTPNEVAQSVQEVKDRVSKR